MGLAFLEQEVLKKWRSFRRLYTFLEKEFDRINRGAFMDVLPPATIQLKRLRYCRDILEGGYIGAAYHPPREEEPAKISFFPIVLLNKQDATTALAHEMVHHWEWMMGHRLPESLHIPEAYAVIRQQFSDPEKEYSWRLAHSSRFIAKAWEIAQFLDLSLKDFLFKS